jgi:hypothetical protein
MKTLDRKDTVKTDKMVGLKIPKLNWSVCCGAIAFECLLSYIYKNTTCFIKVYFLKTR